MFIGQPVAYLKKNVLIEPLINHWYAWPYLIPPAPASMYATNSQLRIMESFIANPRLHVTALRNPAMIGGPFINYDEGRAKDVENLLKETRSRQARLHAMAQSIKTLNDILLSEADGHSLEPLYEKIPPELKGYVEFVYDLNNHPSIRFIERLLYKSDYYDESAQGIALSLIKGDNRPFVFSTPRLDDEGRCKVNIPFRRSELDELFKAKSFVGSVPRLMESLGVTAKDSDLFSSFFTEQPPDPVAGRSPRGFRVRYFGHACVLIQSDEVSILCDPVVSYKVDNCTARYTYADLPEKLDYILITHNHQDHCLFETLLQLRYKTDRIVVPRSGTGTLQDPSLKLILENVGFTDIVELEEMQTLEDRGVAITNVPFFGEHADLDIRTKSAYFVEVSGKRILLVADSNNLLAGIYENVHKIIGNADILFIGMECDGGPLSWLYGPLMLRPLNRKMDQSRRFSGSDCEKALDMVRVFNPSQAYVYAMGQEPWLTFLTSIQYTSDSRPIVESDRFVQQCRNLGIVSERLFGCKDIF